MTKTLSIIASILFVSACGKTEDKSSTTPTTSDCNSSLSFATDIKSIVSASGSGACAGCHSGYDTLSGLQADKSKVYSEVSTESQTEP